MEQLSRADALSIKEQEESYIVDWLVNSSVLWDALKSLRMMMTSISSVTLLSIRM